MIKSVTAPSFPVCTLWNFFARGIVCSVNLFFFFASNIRSLYMACLYVTWALCLLCFCISHSIWATRAPSRKGKRYRLVYINNSSTSHSQRFISIYPSHHQLRAQDKRKWLVTAGAASSLHSRAISRTRFWSDWMLLIKAAAKVVWFALRWHSWESLLRVYCSASPVVIWFV